MERKKKKKTFVTNSLLGASFNSLYYSFLHNFLLMRWKKASSSVEREKVIVLFSHLPMLVALLMCLEEKDAENDVIDGIVMATVLWNNTFWHCYSAHKKGGLSFKHKQIVPFLNAPMNFAFLKIYRLVWSRKDPDIIYLSVYITLWC